jgi:predicted dinucleotide-binding enzyme
MKIGILGSGIVAQTLAGGFIKYGHEVMVGTGNPSKLKEFQEKNLKAKIGTFDQAATFGDTIVVAVKGTAAEEVVRSVSNKISGKTVIDTTNPIANKPPVNGVLEFFTSMNESLMERLQKIVPSANFVKCFNNAGSYTYINPDYAGGKPTMFICGNNDASRKEVSEILNAFGWEAADMGKANAAGAIEQLCVLWCIPGLNGAGWTHAFKLLKA